MSRTERRGSRLSGAGNHDAEERHRIDHLVLEVSFLYKQLLTIQAQWVDNAKILCYAPTSPSLQYHPGSEDSSRCFRRYGKNGRVMRMYRKREMLQIS